MGIWRLCIHGKITFVVKCGQDLETTKSLDGGQDSNYGWNKHRSWSSWRTDWHTHSTIYDIMQLHTEREPQGVHSFEITKIHCHHSTNSGSDVLGENIWDTWLLKGSLFRYKPAKNIKNIGIFKLWNILDILHSIPVTICLAFLFLFIMITLLAMLLFVTLWIDVCLSFVVVLLTHKLLRVM